MPFRAALVMALSCVIFRRPRPGLDIAGAALWVFECVPRLVLGTEDLRQCPWHHIEGYAVSIVERLGQPFQEERLEGAPGHSGYAESVHRIGLVGQGTDSVSLVELERINVF